MFPNLNEFNEVLILNLGLHEAERKSNRQINQVSRKLIPEKINS